MIWKETGHIAGRAVSHMGYYFRYAAKTKGKMMRLVRAADWPSYVPERLVRIPSLLNVVDTQFTGV